MCTWNKTLFSTVFNPTNGFRIEQIDDDHKEHTEVCNNVREGHKKERLRITKAKWTAKKKAEKEAWWNGVSRLRAAMEAKEVKKEAEKEASSAKVNKVNTEAVDDDV